jgi:hypothetical protein
MAYLFVARSAKLSRWGSDVGFGKHIYKIGVSDADPRDAVSAGWAGETDWKLIRREEAGDLSETDVIERLRRREKQIDPRLYPKLKGAIGVFRVAAEHVENHIVVSRALAGDSDRLDLRLTPTDFAAYLTHNALR